jgi:hypothetical protein
VKLLWDFQTDKSLPYCNQGRGVQSPDWSHAVPQLPTLQPCLGYLQTTSPLYVVRERSPAKGGPWKDNTVSILTCCNCKSVVERNLIPPNIEAAGMPRKRCERESRRERPRLQGEGCSLPATPPQDFPSRQRYAATAAASGASDSLICAGLTRSNGEMNATSLVTQPKCTESVSSGSKCKEFISEWHFESSRDGISADLDKIQWGRVRRR